MLPSITGFLGGGGTPASTTAYESIATVTVGSGGASYAEFTSIPSTYSHLQIRILASMTASGADDLKIQFNSDTGNNYARHYLGGNGSSAFAGATTTTNAGIVGINTLPTASNTFGVAIVDVLDYANTNKLKTMRALGGNDTNGAGYIGLSSTLWQSTSAITSIKLFPFTSTFPQYSSFALYGVK